MYGFKYIIILLFFTYLLVWLEIIWSFVLLITLIMAILLAVSGTISAYIMLSMKHQVRHVLFFSSYSDFHKNLVERYIIQSHKVPDRLPLIFGRSVDFVLQDLLDLVIRDLISSWLKDLSFFCMKLQYLIKKEIWLALIKLHERLIAIDETKFIAVDIISKLTAHFEKIRSVQTITVFNSHGIFNLSNHLMSMEKEMSYLRKISEFLLVSLFSKSLINHTINKNLLVEILACKVFYPLATLATDPDYINQKILEFTTHMVENHNHHYDYCHAESYQEFIQLIQNSEDIDSLKHIRYSIMTEIMQVTTVKNLRKSKDVDKEIYHSDSRKLKRYLGQLTFAKTQCEERLQAIGYSGFYPEQSRFFGDFNKMIPFEKILESVHGRKMLSKFLEKTNQEYLLIYWAAVEELRATEKINWHQIATEIYYTFIHSPMSPIKVHKSIRRRMESFLLGNSGPEVFYEVQENVLDLLQNKIYPAFISSEDFLLYTENIEFSTQDHNEVSRLCVEKEKDESEQLGYGKNKLNQLQERLNNKSQALQALKISLKPESRVLSGLQKEVEHLEGEKRQLEAHLSRTEVWSEHLGKWRAVVQSAEIPEDKDPPQFVLVVHVLEDETDSEAVSTGWVVLRKLPEFYELHRKLLQVWVGVKQLELPSQTPKSLFGKSSDKSYLEKAKSLIQKYLEFVLMDEHLNASEALYTFLSPSSEHLKTTMIEGISSPKKNRFSLSTLFKSSNQQGNSEGSRDSDEDDLSLFDEDVRLYNVEGIDAIAEPLYALLGEIFDLHGVFRWLRKTLITFVQITYGRTITRQIGEIVAWLFSEQMLHYFIQVLTQCWWPNGVLVSENPLRSNDEKLKIRLDAKIQFVSNTPEVLNNLVGQANAKRGALKIFEVLQDVRLNKQLFYVKSWLQCRHAASPLDGDEIMKTIKEVEVNKKCMKDLLETLIYEVFPELKKVPKKDPLKKRNAF